MNLLLFLVVVILLVMNLSIMYRVQLMTDRIDDNLVDIEMMKMKVEKVTDDLGVQVFRLGQKIGGD